MIHIKSAAEIDKMRKAGEIIAILFEKLGEIIKPGNTTVEIDKFVYDFIIAHEAYPSFLGYEGPAGAGPFPGSICASVNEEVIHGIPGLRRLENGDILSVDVGVYADGYHADAARTFGVGDISDEAADIIRIAKEAFYKGIEKVIEGNRITDISEAIQKHVEDAGYSVVRKYVGHGIGRSLHESPDVPNYKTNCRGVRLATGMTIAIEPMINGGSYDVKTLDNGWTVVTLDGKLSAHYENTVAVNASEPIILTCA